MDAEARALSLEPHHDGSPLYVSEIAPTLGERVRVRVRVPHSLGPVAHVHTRSNPDHEPRFSVATRVATADGWHWWEAEVEVENPVHGYRFRITTVAGRAFWLNTTGVHTIETLDSEDFKLVTYPAPPHWAASTVMYQVFPDRFARSGDAAGRTLPSWAEPAQWGDEPVHIGPSTAVQFFGGDLDGIAEHLDHLERLGITMIYLTPVFPARSNHRYDALSFDRVDPLLGGDEALIRLVEAAHARGFTVIGDLTTNHSGDAHEWFEAAHRTPSAPESDFYYWLDAEQEHYVSWLGVPSLPKFNWNSAELRRRFIEGGDSVVAKWLKPPYSLDGWRIDVANMTGRYRDDDLNQEVRRVIRQTMIDVNPHTILLAESAHDASSDFQGDAWHGAMTYTNFTHPIWGWLWEETVPVPEDAGLAVGTVASHSGLAYTGREVFAAHQRFVSGFPWRVRLSNMNALDTHDTARFLTHARPGTVPVALGMCTTLPGIPMIFAGDEFGLVGDDGEHSRTAIPWHEVDAAAASIHLYSALIHLRTAHEALNTGGMRWLHVDDEVLVYARESAAESVLVVAARGDFDVVLPRDAVAGELSLLFVSEVGVNVVGESGGGSGAPTAEYLGESGTALHLRGRGPVFAAWHLPGLDLPGFADVGTVLELKPEAE